MSLRSEIMGMAITGHYDLMMHAIEHLCWRYYQIGFADAGGDVIRLKKRDSFDRHWGHRDGDG